jgi:hypothetical protein
VNQIAGVVRTREFKHQPKPDNTAPADIVDMHQDQAEFDPESTEAAPPAIAEEGEV